MFDDRQTQAGATKGTRAGPVDAVKTFPNALKIGAVDTDAVIRNGEDDLLVGLAEVDADSSARLGVCNCIDDEIIDRLA